MININKHAYEIVCLHSGKKKSIHRYYSKESALKDLIQFKPSTKIVEIYRLGLDNHNKIFYRQKVNQLFDIRLNEHFITHANSLKIYTYEKDVCKMQQNPTTYQTFSEWETYFGIKVTDPIGFDVTEGTKADLPNKLYGQSDFQNKAMCSLVGNVDDNGLWAQMIRDYIISMKDRESHDSK